MLEPARLSLKSLRFLSSQWGPPHKPENPDWHPEDVKAAVGKTGTTLTQLSIKAGYQPKSFQSVLKRQWPRVEAIIAKHLRRQPWSIWPSRYDAQHKPLTRPSPCRSAAP